MEKDNINKGGLINVIFSSVAAASAVALILTPFDMVFFKMIAKTANMSSKSSFLQIAKDLY